MSLLKWLDRVIDFDEKGMLSAHDVIQELAQVLERGLEDHDPELSDALIRALDTPSSGPELLGYVAWAAFRAAERSWTSDGSHHTLRDVRNAVKSRISDGRESGISVSEQARMVACIPPQWSDDEALDALLGEADGEERVAVLRELLGVIRHHKGDLGMFALAARPYLDSDDASAVGLLAAIYLAAPIASRSRRELLQYLDRHRASLDWPVLITVAQQLSIDCLDDLAVAFARAAFDAGLPAGELPIGGIILWIAGEREAARATAERFEKGPQGWWTQGAESLALFIQASSATPAGTAAILAPSRPSEGLVKRPATVGALVGRLSYLRMRAFVALDRWDQAVAEAEAVDRYYGYRHYDLHLQAPNGEFDVRLVDRIAVTPDELLEARELHYAHTEIERWQPSLMEGRVLWRERADSR